MGISLSADGLGSEPSWLPPAPSSPPLEAFLGGPDPALCAEWNPEFGYRGYKCCYKPVVSTRRRRATCSPDRRDANHCDEMTPEQRAYTEAAESGRLGDVLQIIDQSKVRFQQAYCGVNTGFLAFGRRLIPSETNRIAIRNRHRCIDFGTDAMVGMLEWLGRQVAQQYSTPEYLGTKLLVGDISAPRGGCLIGRRGRRGHASHTSGQDADIGFLEVRPGRASPEIYTKKIDPRPNWWLVKKMFQNPYACVKVIFLDRKHIAKLAREAAGDPDWYRYGKYLRHVKHHKDHYHVRIGDGPGAPGCRETGPEEEELEDGGEGEGETEAGTDPNLVQGAPKTDQVRRAIATSPKP